MCPSGTKMLLLLLSVCLGLSSAQILQNGRCGSLRLQNEFNLEKFTGRWYSVRGISPLQNGDCSYIDIEPPTSDNYDYQIHMSYVNMNGLADTTGTAVAIGSSASFNLTLESQRINFNVLSTDYDSYAFAFSCENVGESQRNVYIWQLARDTSVSNAAITNLVDQAIFDNFGLTAADLTVTQHSQPECFVQSEARQGLILQGRCNENIDVVQSFDINRFQGEWRLISSYANRRQSGTCNRARYTVRGNSLDVQNSHVRNRELGTVSGTADFALPNVRNGKFVVRINNNTEDYWILDTDYDSYALAYSCKNLDNNQYRVYSWKLSRTNTLTPQANENINRIISQVDALRDNLFIAADQSPAACFYLPPVDSSKPVVFPGQCSQNIPVVNNFNSTRYMDEWYDIESYPSSFQYGTCNTGTYTERGNEVDVVNTQVVNGVLSTRQAVGLFTEGNRVAKLKLNFGTEDRDYWVLDTDYISYALVYSCKNLDANTKQVGAWKLSRSKRLSTGAQIEIDAAMANVDVLDARYFIERDHSASGCFYLPDIPAGEPVIMPGQCNPNIPVVTNFNASRYMGAWYDIESYPSSFQYGTCNTGTYTERGNEVDVVNTQVVDGALSTRRAVGVFTEGNRVAKLKLNFGTEDRDYWVLGTDYISYALVYSCKNVDANRRQVGAWKLSRSKRLSTGAQIEIDAVMANVDVLDARYFIERDHSASGCFYLPDIPAGEPVIMPGQCNPNIPVVTNFNANRYMGEWYDIESYPSSFQYGTCNTGTYTERGNEVDVVNTQVVDGALSTRRAVGVFTEGNRVAKLKLNFGTEDRDYWVLGTDYISYALVYSCKNLDANRRQVGAWKLSRTRQLSTSAITAIDSVMANVDVLDARYFVQRNHSDSGCFYLPDIPAGQPIIIPGQCDPNIPVVRSFSVDRYSGTWYQIEKYYQRFEGGNCTGARYTPNSNTGVVTVLNWQVVDGVLDTIQGTATVNSTDGSAKLLVRLPIRSSDVNNPQFRETNLYVLDTDYTSYSLAYSCSNVDSNRRAIGAWKLSRSRVMSQAGNNAINKYMADRQELHSSYFIAVDQCECCPEPSSASFLKNSIIMLVLLSVSLIYLS